MTDNEPATESTRGPASAAPAAKGERPSLRWIVHVALALLGLGLAIVAFIKWESRGHRPTAVHAAAPMQAIPVSVVIVQRRDVPLTPTYLGRTESSQRVDIRARVNGFLEEVGFQEGTRVEEGTVLFRIDPRPFEVRLNEARAALTSAEARLDQARRRVERARSAAQGGAVSQTELDQWLTEEQVAAADVELQRARVATAALELSYTSVTSPITGQIGETAQDVGSYVQSGAESLLATVQQVDPIYVSFSVSEQELRAWQEMIAAGEVSVPPEGEIPLSVQLIDGTTYPHTGRLSFLGVELAPTTGTAMARGVLPNPDGLLRPGQFLRVTALDIRRIGTILVPQRAVMQTPAGASVYIVDGSNLAQSRPVTLGEWVGDAWIIRHGVNAGDRVIVDQLVKLRPGTPVAATVLPETASERTAPAENPALPAPLPAPPPAALRPEGHN